jgi:hypothetical protein
MHSLTGAATVEAVEAYIETRGIILEIAVRIAVRIAGSACPNGRLRLKI